jgi:predicted aspartyl protease
MTRRIRIAIVLLVGAMVGSGHATELERSMAALGTEKMKTDTVVVLRGTSRFMGTDGRFTLAFDAEGRFVETIEGPISRSSGFDGDSAWEVDWNGIPRDLELGERDELLLRLWAATGLWTRSPAALRVDEFGEGFRLSIAEGGMVAEVAVDAKTALPTSFRYQLGATASTTDLSDYDRKSGLSVPRRIETRSEGGDEMILTAEQAAFTSQFDFRRPTSLQMAASFDAAAPASLEIKVAPTQHLMVRGVVNGHDVGWFIFDSGAGANVLSTTAAEAVGADAIGSTSVLGVGGSVEGTVYRVESLTVGPLTLDDPLMIGVDLSPYEPHLGVKLGGIIGYGLLAHAVVTYEFDGPTIKLTHPATHKLEGASWEDLLLYNRTSHVEAEFEGHRGVFLLDTGAANASVGIYAPATERLGLLTSRDVDTVFATEMEGVYADPYVSGTVGGQILSDFTLVLDYARSRIALVPR